MTGFTLVEKIAGTHRTDGGKGPVRTGEFTTIRPAHILTHDNTSPVMAKFMGLGAAKIADPKQPVYALDHDIQNTTEENLAKYAKIERFAADMGIDFYPAGSGIGHQMMVEYGYVLPGRFVVGSDSHSNLYGALGALGTPVVRTDAAAVWATGEFWWSVPQSVQVVLTGSLPVGATGKDVIITLCGLYNQGEVLNAAVEFSGPGVATLDQDARFSISNMTTEWGALVGWFPPDDVTRKWLEWRKEMIGGDGRLDDLDQVFASAPLPDSDAIYAARITLDLSTVTPHVSGPDSVQVMTSVQEMAGRRLRIHKAYLVSCVNSRFEDIAAAAAVLKGKRIATGVEFYLAAASKEVQRRSEEAGHWQTILAAGGKPLPPGCGPCIGLGIGLLEAGQVGISATNRNFKGRMGSRDAQAYLASPAVVAASAIAGYITGPEEYPPGSPEPQIEVFPAPAHETGAVEIMAGFPGSVQGRYAFLPQDNLNTDGIYGKDYTYRDDMTKEMMAEVVMGNYDPGFATRIRPGDIIVGARNFGTGSSREQAATALQAAGIAMVIAGSFSQTYLRNAFNNGFLCIECPELVDYLQAKHPGDEKTVLTGDQLSVDFQTSKVSIDGKVFAFPPLGPVPQKLIVAGGAENVVRERLQEVA